MKFQKLFSKVACLAGAAWLCCAVPIAVGGDLETLREKVRAKHPSVPPVSTTQLAAWLADTKRVAPVLLDVRTDAEFAISHLPGARRVDPSSGAAEVMSTVETGRPVVVYCSVGYRSSELAERLRKAGLRKVFNLDGAIFQWANEGRPLEKAGKPTKTVHPYNNNFGKLLKEEYRAQVQE